MIWYLCWFSCKESDNNEADEVPPILKLLGLKRRADDDSSARKIKMEKVIKPISKPKKPIVSQGKVLKTIQLETEDIEMEYPLKFEFIHGSRRFEGETTLQIKIDHCLCKYSESH